MAELQSGAPAVAEIESAQGFADGERAALRDLILVLADSKRLLGMRYADWTLGAPELEAGIACASMAQDEWGHARQLYALLRDFGDDTEQLEHGREADAYRSLSLLDEAPASWPEVVVLNALADTALTVQFEALTSSSYLPLRQRCEKLLDEERFHLAHGAAWFRRLAGANARAREAARDATDRALPAILQWFGPEGARARIMTDAGIVDETPGEMRCRYVGRVGPLLELVGVSVPADAPDFADFREEFRRAGVATPDPAVIARLRGDRNRVFLMD
ncbi:MAG TPA: Phenylacetic acid catabolic protein [Longimicrobiales bacterium]|nr:Phenylacetic acid catabolic protein [Longimicrobiales bacterium]